MLIEKRLSDLEKAGVFVVSVWEHHWKPRKGKGNSGPVRLYSNGHLNAADSPAKWEKKGATLIFRWEKTQIFARFQMMGDPMTGTPSHRRPMSGERLFQDSHFANMD